MSYTNQAMVIGTKINSISFCLIAILSLFLIVPRAKATARACINGQCYSTEEGTIQKSYPEGQSPLAEQCLPPIVQPELPPVEVAAPYPEEYIEPIESTEKYCPAPQCTTEEATQYKSNLEKKQKEVEEKNKNIEEKDKSIKEWQEKYNKTIVELNSAKNKLQTYENLISSQKSEISDLKSKNNELEKKLAAKKKINFSLVTWIIIALILIGLFILGLILRRRLVVVKKEPPRYI